MADQQQVASAPMTADELRDCLDALQWSQTGLAGYLDRDPGTVRQWARGKREIPLVVAVWLREISAPLLAHPWPEGWRYVSPAEMRDNLGEGDGNADRSA